MNNKILITGSAGLCGSALKEESVNFPQYDFIFLTRQDGDLRKKEDIDNIFKKYQPDICIHTAARVGGIGGNAAMHEEFYYDNVLMNTYIVRACIENKVKKFFGFSSVCVFPNNLSLLEEDKINDGPVYDGNFAYGYAKRGLNTHIEAAEKQYGIKNYVSIIPGNIFGKHDMFSIEYGHIIPSLIHKLYKAHLYNPGSSLEVWGDGNSLREIIYVNDIARAILSLLNKENLPNKIIISGRREYSIREIVDLLCEITNFDKDFVRWDISKPNGQRSRPTSKKVIDNLLPYFQYTNIREALGKTWSWFNSNYPNVRTKY